MSQYLQRLSNNFRDVVGNFITLSGSRGNVSLNAAYVHQTSGPAVAVRFLAQSATTVDEFYMMMDTKTGTLGNITMEAKIYNENTSFPDRPGSTLRATSTACTMPSGDDMWIKFTFGTPYTAAIGEVLWIVIYNTSSAPATDYPQILTATNARIGVYNNDIEIMTCYSTANGFSTNGSIKIQAPFVIKQNTIYFGQPFTLGTSSGSSSLERGFEFTPTVDITVCGFLIMTQTTAYNAVRLLASNTAPGGTALYTWDLDSDASQTIGDLLGAKLFTPITLTGGTTYKLTMTYSSTTTAPGYLQIEDYSSYSSMFDSLVDNDKINICVFCVDDGAGGWTKTKDKRCYGMALILQDYVLSASGGGNSVIGSGIIVPGY